MSLEEYYKVSSVDMVDVADTIRTKGGTQAAITWPAGWKDAINAISAGVSSRELLFIINVENISTMNYANVANGIAFTYNGGASIGCSALAIELNSTFGINPSYADNRVTPFVIPSTAKRIRYHIAVGNSAYNISDNRFRPFVGVRSSLTYNMIGTADSYLLVKNTYNTLNYESDEVLDLTSVNQDSYLYIGSPGVTATFTNISIEY